MFDELTHKCKVSIYCKILLLFFVFYIHIINFPHNEKLFIEYTLSLLIWSWYPLSLRKLCSQKYLDRMCDIFLYIPFKYFYLTRKRLIKMYLSLETTRLPSENILFVNYIYLSINVFPFMVLCKDFSVENIQSTICKFDILPSKRYRKIIDLVWQNKYIVLILIVLWVLCCLIPSRYLIYHSNK